MVKKQQKQASKRSSSNRESIFDRLSRTDTYASRKLKEKVHNLNKEPGRPLFNIEVQLQHNNSSAHVLTESTFSVSSIPEIKNSYSSGTTGTVSTCSSNSISGCSKASTRTESARRSASESASTSTHKGPQSQSVFDRLANTGTKSSLRKHKKSATYIEEEDTLAERVMKNKHCRNNDQGGTTLRGTSASASANMSTNMNISASAHTDTGIIRREKGNMRFSFFPHKNEAEI
jgi:hypothetical protein